MTTAAAAIESLVADPTSRDEDANVYALFDTLDILDAEGRAAAKREFAMHPAVAAILSLELNPFANDHDAIASALEPILTAAPRLRGWSEDDELTAAEEAVCVVASFINEVSMGAGDKRWKERQNLIVRLRNLQVRHLEAVACDRIGEFPGYDVRGQGWWAWGAPGGMSIQIRVGNRPILSLPGDVTRREVEMAIRGWKAGHDQGLHEGAERIRRGIKDLLAVEAA